MFKEKNMQVVSCMLQARARGRGLVECRYLPDRSFSCVSLLTVHFVSVLGVKPIFNTVPYLQKGMYAIRRQLYMYPFRAMHTYVIGRRSRPSNSSMCTYVYKPAWYFNGRWPK